MYECIRNTALQTCAALQVNKDFCCSSVGCSLQDFCLLDELQGHEWSISAHLSALLQLNSAQLNQRLNLQCKTTHELTTASRRSLSGSGSLKTSLTGLLLG
jgi:hypothetical protein